MNGCNMNIPTPNRANEEDHRTDMLRTQVQMALSKRSTFKPQLNTMSENAKALTEALVRLLRKCEFPAFQKLSGRAKELLESAQAHASRCALEYQRATSDTITFALVAAEKQGKSQILKTLTEIPLPVDDHRCTGAICSLIFESDVTKHRFEVKHHSRRSFFQFHIRPVLGYFAECEKDLQSQELITRIDELLSASSGGSKAETETSVELLRKCATLAQGKKGHAPQGLPARLWRDLEAIGKKAVEIVDRLDGGVLEEKGLDAARLEKFVKLQDYNNIEPLTVEWCRIYCSWPKGTDYLRLIDTPGIDNPNPYAKETAYKIMLEDADAVLIVHRPKDQPDPTSGILGQLRDVEKLREGQNRLPATETAVLLNYESKYDPTHALAYRARLHEDRVRRIYGPVDGLKDRNALTMAFQEIAAAVAEEILDIDARRRGRLSSDWESIRSNAQLLFREIRRDFTGAASVDQLAFDYVIERYEQFVPALSEHLSKCAAEMPSSTEAAEIQTKVADRWAQIKTQLAITESTLSSRISQEIGAGRNASLEIMRDLIWTEVLRIQTELRDCNENMRSFAFQLVMDAIGSAEPGLVRLLKEGKRPEERLKTLCETIRETHPKSEIADRIRECAEKIAGGNIQSRTQFDAIEKLSDSAQWGPDTLEEMLDRARQALPTKSVPKRPKTGGTAKVDSKECAKAGFDPGPWLQSAKVPSNDQEARVHLEFCKNLQSCIHAILDGLFDREATWVAMTLKNHLESARSYLTNQSLLSRGWIMFLYARRAAIWEEKLSVALQQAAHNEEMNRILQAAEAALA